MITLRPAVVTASTTASWRSLPVVHRRAEAGQDEQRVVDPDADPDQPRHRRGPVGDVDDVGEQDDQAARGDAEADERDRERQAGGDHRAEGDQQHDRGAEEADPLRARLLLGGVDRVPAELDLEPVAAVRLGGVDQLLAVLLRRRPSRGPSAGAWSSRSCRPRETRIGVCSATWSTCSASAKKASTRCSRARGSWRRPRPSRRRRSPGRSSRRSARSVRSLAAFDSDPGVS